MTVLVALFVSPVAATSSSVLVGVKHKMRATLITPDGNGPYPGVLVLHRNNGVESADLQYAGRLAKEGYVCLVPAFTEAYGITPDTRDNPFTTHAPPIYADLVDALDMLRHNEKVGGSKLGALGFSNGAYFALWLAATNKIEAGVSYYGAISGAGTTGAFMGHWRAVFSRTSAQVLILHGSVDSTVPVAVARLFGDILNTAHSPHEIHIYPGVGHLFERQPISPADRAAAEDSWQRTLEFLRKYLKQP